MRVANRMWIRTYGTDAFLWDMPMTTPVVDALVALATVGGVTSLPLPLLHAARNGRAEVVSALPEGGGGGLWPSCDPEEMRELMHADLVGVDPPSAVHALLAHAVSMGPCMLRNRTWMLPMLIAVYTNSSVHSP